MQPRLTVRLATRGELDAATGLLDAVARDLAGRGIQQWPVPYRRDWLEPHIANAELHLAYVDEALAGTVAVCDGDAEVWGAQPPTALYVHRLGVHPSRRGQQIGSALLAWAAGEARRRGRRALRLDCSRENAALVGYYVANGFSAVGEVQVRSYRGLLMERVLG